MYQIGEASEQTGLTAKTIRYYEEAGLIPPADRKPNGYRIYGDDDLDRLRFIRSARALAFPLEDIEEILAFRDRGEPPCLYVMTLMEDQIDSISQRILELERLRDELRRLHARGQSLPEDVDMKSCICHTIQAEA
ncbi:MAG: heavy metal-responsive transcriptional regulator [Anaerolineales bacterium]|nr:heavy metal-responsive transcriptional regulator [Anaerolineales bacterium]